MENNNPNNHSSWFNSLLGLIISVIFWLFIGLISSIIIEWLGIYFSWWDSGLNHSTLMLDSELKYANETVREVLTGTDKNSWIYFIFDKFTYTLQVSLKLLNNIFSSFLPEITNISLEGISIFINAAFNISLVFILRVFLIIFSIPLFLMALMWGFVDGLVERDLRRFGAGRESSTIFDAARRLIMPFLIAPFIIYLSFPSSINPMFVIGPSAVFQCFLYRTLFSKYKKYF